ncbi:helix-turn-helix transcriptional regulator [Rhodocyclaceae bacterium SMB388]
MDAKTEAPIRIIRRHEVESRTGIARSTIYERVKQGTFPAPIQLGPRAVGWISADIDAWIAGRIEAAQSGK